MNDTYCQELGQKTGGYIIQIPIVMKSYLREAVFIWKIRINRNSAKLLAELPPVEVEISLYGATKKTYESISRVPGSFNRCMRGIHLLLEEGVNLKLKTIIINENKHEIEQMKEFAKSLGINFRYDAVIIPCLTGDKTPYDHRLSPQETVKYNFDSVSKRAFWKHQLETRPLQTEYLYLCGAALTTFNIDPFGGLGACLIQSSTFSSFKNLIYVAKSMS